MGAPQALLLLPLGGKGAKQERRCVSPSFGWPWACSAISAGRPRRTRQRDNRPDRTRRRTRVDTQQERGPVRSGCQRPDLRPQCQADLGKSPRDGLKCCELTPGRSPSAALGGRRPHLAQGEALATLAFGLAGPMRTGALEYRQALSNDVRSAHSPRSETCPKVRAMLHGHLARGSVDAKRGDEASQARTGASHCFLCFVHVSAFTA